MNTPLKITITILTLLFVTFINAQDISKDSKADLEALNKAYITKEQELKDVIDELPKNTNQFPEDAKKQFENAVKLKKELDALYEKREVYFNYYKLKGITEESLNSSFKKPENYAVFGQTIQEQAVVDEKPTSFLMYGNNELVKISDIKDDKTKLVFESILAANSKTNLGKFEIPGYGQKVPIYINCKKDNCCEKNRCENCKGYIAKNILNGKSKLYKNDLTFVEVSVEINDGAMVDIRAILIDEEKKEKYYFENKLPTSLLKDTKTGNDTYLNCSFITSIDDTKKAYNYDNSNLDCKVTLKDILQYFPNAGNNYTPDDQNFVFPVPGKDNQNSTNRREYLLNQDTALQNTVELRTYTDFIGLFNGSANGIVQLEGKASFFINPFSQSYHNIYWVKKIEPFVHYTKIDDANRGLTLTPYSITGTDTISKVKHPLEILQKSQLEMGFLLNLASFKFSKEYPFKTNIYLPVRYNATSISKSKENNETLKMVGLGLGLNFEFKKFSNFGFNLSTEFTRYNPTNRSETIINPTKFWVFSNEAELYYYPGESKNQSIFTRFRTFYNKSDDKDSFFQFQFGYRFAIGAGKVKTKN